MFWSKKKVTKGNDNLKLFEKRMKEIKYITDRNMKPAQCGTHFPVR